MEAGGLLGQRATGRAKPDSLPGMEHRVGQLFHHRRIGLDDVQRDAFGGTRPDAGQFVQRGNQRGDGTGSADILIRSHDALKSSCILLQKHGSFISLAASSRDTLGGQTHVKYNRYFESISEEKQESR